MKIETLNIDNNFIKIRYRIKDDNRTTFLCIHGLGETGDCFKEIFEYPLFEKFNIIVPDLLGYGGSYSEIDEDYGFENQRKLLKIVDFFELDNLIVLGHSIGGAIGTKLCFEDGNKRIKKLTNIEGNLTQYQNFIS